MGPVVIMQPTELSLFRYSAVTWNMHRVHYDAGWAAHEGHAGLLVHSHYHAAHSLRAVTEWLGSGWTLAGWEYRILHPAFAGSILRAQAAVSDLRTDVATLSVTEHDETDNICLKGTATVRRV